MMAASAWLSLSGLVSGLESGLEPAPGPAPAPLPSPSADTAGTIQLSPIAVALSAAVLSINGIISLHFRLGLHTQLVVASTR